MLDPPVLVACHGLWSDTDLEQCMNHLTGIGREAVARSESDRTLAIDITVTDIAYQFLALVRIVQLLPDGRAGDIEHYVNVPLRGIEHRHSRSRSRPVRVPTNDDGDNRR
jgi:hypothetical protein